jgi:hypothetical protein
MSKPESSRSSPHDALGRPAGGFGFGMFEPNEFEADPLAIEPDDGESGPLVVGPTLGDRMRAWALSSVRPVIWTVVAAAVALGSAGIVAATDHFADAETKPELTWAADRALSARLDTAVEGLLQVSADVDLLAQMALDSLTALDQASLAAAREDGDRAVASIERRTAALDAQLACGAWTAARDGDLARVNSPALIDRYHRVCRALAAAEPLAGHWQSLVAGSSVFMQVVGDIEAHDLAAGEALQAAAGGRYDEALAKLDVATAALADATTISDQLKALTDVYTLSELLSRYRQMDDALRLLWQIERESAGSVTPQVLAAMKVINEKKALLPTTNAFIRVVSHEMSGQIRADAIAIEVARGSLEGELSALVGGSVFGGP